ncbi:hypothetical protein Pst134EA_028025 [Puccinia striiformis f. sp. tritici]|uniref:hypothetical protein n=1 Tax=Puccinia striiformis f. sp. tritici TaxID=168172 RepID=UPI00200814AF|nr:hypothetical protein Pst134EA_028025 [Puccinia striiformis f. sp. tritici]KAH9448732.1 hypothetical protein Pst134EA_028025 [Puccinia striiformis f. sp. tritici]
MEETTRKKTRTSIIERIPSEIWDYILNQLPNSSLQETSRNLSQIIRNISIVYRYKHLIVKDDQELKELISQTYHHNINRITHSISLLSWRLIDNNLLINLINSFDLQLRIINLLIGPLFAPEQLEELFVSQKPNLELLSLRFNQNVSRRSYEPFLKGAYFDNCLDLISRWPHTPSFQSFSFVQDPPPSPVHDKREKEKEEGIAQPIILFRFWSITNLAVSIIGRNITRLRFRIPGRNLTDSLTNNLNNSIKYESIKVGRQDFKLPILPFPSLKFLDISTSILTSITSGLNPILRKFSNLEYLIIDRVNLIFPVRSGGGFESELERVDETLRLIGLTCSGNSGIGRSIEINRMWRDLNKLYLIELDHEKVNQHRSISMPDDFPPPSNSTSSSAPLTGVRRKKAGRSAYASAPRWKKPSEITSENIKPTISDESSFRLPLKNQRIPEKVTVIPSKSNLKCISIGTDLSSSSSSSYGSEEDLKEEKKTRERWIDQFRLGWFDGISKLEITVREKLDEHLRAIDSWNKSIVKLQDSFDDDDDGHADELGLDDQRNHLQESFERLVDCKPVMITTSSSFANNLNHHHNDDNKEGNQSEINSDTVFQKFIKSQDLTEISITQVEDLLLNLSLLKTQSLGAEGPPILCTIDGCSKYGKVAWKASSSKDLPVKLLSTKSERLIDVDLPDSGGSGQDDLHALFRDLTLHDHQNQTQTQNHFSFTSNLHPLNCAHTEARKVWDIDFY